MLTDSFFQQGVTHEVCEDYAVHGDDFVVVADGCSNGGGPSIDSDWGARLLCKIAEGFLFDPDSQHIKPETLLAIIGQKAHGIIEPLNLKPECLTATLMTMRALAGNFQAMVVGDGVVGGKRKDGRWKIHVIDFDSAPFYLKYNIFEEEEIYFKHRKPEYGVTTYFGHLMSPALEMDEFVPLRDRYAIWAEDFSITDKQYVLDPKSPQIMFNFPMEDYEFAFVCSDGVESFYHPMRTELQKSNETIFVLDVLRVLLDFPNRPGLARIQRNWVFKQDRKGTFLRRNWKNGDDVSVGVIHG